MFPLPISNRLSFHARHALKEARDIARYTKSEYIESRHLLLALSLEEGSLGSILLENIGFKKDEIGKYCLQKKSLAKFKSAKSRKTATPPLLSLEVQNILKRAFFLASEHHYPYVGTEHIMGALLETPQSFLDELIAHLNIDPQRIEAAIESHLHFEQFPQMARMFDLPDFNLSDQKGDSSTPFLDQYTIDLAKASNTQPTIIGREAELERLIQVLGRKEKRNAILLGDPGVGKTALVTALAQRIQAGLAGPLLKGKRILGLDLALLVAGTSFRGEFETRVKELLKELRENQNIILFIDEIHSLVGTGNTQGGLDAANILKPALARGEIQCIGATTLAEYKRHLEKDSALERRFQTILLREPTLEETIAILMTAKPAYEAHHHVSLPEETLREAARLSVRYIPDRFLPDKAFDLIDEASALVRRRSLQQETQTLPTIQILEAKVESLIREKSILIEKEEYDRAALLQKRLLHVEKELSDQNQIQLQQPQKVSDRNLVTKRDLLTVLSQMTRIPLDRLSHETPAERLKILRQTLKHRVVGQDMAVDKVLHLLTRSLSPVLDPKRPLGSLLLLGPTGVGKTHLAKVLAETFFGDEQALIRLDMSEFMERHSVAQILGAPAGYVGYGEGGKLTEAIRRRPYAVVLFDEIEKAHPDISNILLQILDEGHLTDAEGRRVSFKNTLILLTSNIGTAGFGSESQIGFDESRILDQLSASQIEKNEQTVLQELKTVLRPELLARLDHILVFHPLSQTALEHIASLELEKLKQRLKENHVDLRIQKNVPRAIVTLLQDKKEGARLIRKYITEHIETKLAETLITSPRSTKLSLAVRHGSIKIH